MKITSSQFITSIAAAGKYAEREWTQPEICMAGRSNVGKSSFINMLAGKKGLAKVSNTPGRTRMLNFFLFEADKKFMLVDLPGYGYAAASKDIKNAFAPLIEDYFAASKRLVHTFVLLDIRHAPSADDIRMIDYLYRSQRPFSVFATKADKLSRSAAASAVLALSAATGLGRDDITAVSADGYNREKALRQIFEIIEGDRRL